MKLLLNKFKNSYNGTELYLEMCRVLEANQLSGELPPELGNLPQIQRL